VTGEKGDLGFRTSEYAEGLPVVVTVEPWTFTPTAVSPMAACAPVCVCPMLFHVGWLHVAVGDAA
jgi:hypothetical protein